MVKRQNLIMKWKQGMEEGVEQVMEQGMKQGMKRGALRNVQTRGMKQV